MACILVVDDEEPVRTTLRQMLEKAGHQIFEAANGEEAIRVFEDLKIDLVITDIIMPEKEGIETIVGLRQTAPDLKIIAISGGGRTGNMDFLQLAKKFGANGVLAKPFAVQAVLDAVNSVLEQAE
ncbi:MAG: response regulator [Kiloniellaceae bacterium]